MTKARLADRELTEQDLISIAVEDRAACRGP